MNKISLLMIMTWSAALLDLLLAHIAHLLFDAAFERNCVGICVVARTESLNCSILFLLRVSQNLTFLSHIHLRRTITIFSVWLCLLGWLGCRLPWRNRNISRHNVYRWSWSKGWLDLLKTCPQLIRNLLI